MKKIFTGLFVALIAFTLVGCKGGGGGKRASTPELIGVNHEVQIAIGDSFDPLAGVTAKDRDQKNLNITTTFREEWLNTKIPFNYTYSVVVYNDHGNFAREVVTLKIGDSNVRFSNLRTLQNYYLDSRAYSPIEGLDSFDHTNVNDPVDLTEGITIEEGTTWKHSELKAGETYEVYVESKTATEGAGAVITMKVHEKYDILHEIPAGTKIVLWHANGSDIENMLKTYIASFEKKYPNIKVEMAESKGTYDAVREDMNNAIKGGTPPNIVQGYPDHMAEYLTYNALEPLSPYMFHPEFGFDHGADAVETFSDIVGPYVVENSSISLDGEFYSMPFNKSTEVMIFNDTYMKAVWADTTNNFEEGRYPETWAEMQEFGEAVYKIKDKVLVDFGKNSSPAWTPTILKDYQDSFRPIAYDSVDNAAITALRQWGGGYTARNSNGTGKILFDQGEEAFEVLKYFSQNNKNLTIPSYYAGANYSSDMFKIGRIAATIGSSGGARHNTPTAKFDYTVKPIPYNDVTGRKDVIQQGTNFAVVKMDANEAEKLASWLLVKHLMSADVQIPFSQGTGYTPVRRSIANDPRMTGFFDGKETLGNNAGKDLTGARLMNSRAIQASFEQVAYQFTDVAFVGSSLIRGYWGTALSQSILLPNYKEDEINTYLRRAISNSNRILG